MVLVSYNRFQILGTLATSDTWSCGLNFASDAGEAMASSEADLATWAQGIKSLNGGMVVPASLVTGISSSGNLTGFRVSAISGTTHRETAVAEVTFSTPKGGSNGVQLAQETAMCISLRTGRPGRQSRGRIYWPALGYGLSGAARFTSSTCTGVAADVAQWLVDLRDALGVDGGAGGNQPAGSAGACVVSRVGSSVARISSVEVGDVPDVQRRRRDKQQETYQVATVAQ